MIKKPVTDLTKSIVNKSVRYFATVTLKPRMYQYKAEQQYDMTYPELMKHIYCNDMYECTLIAELTKAYNIHYHMVITFNIENKNVNLRKKFVDSFRSSKVFGFVNISPVDDEERVKEYITKTLEEFQASTGRRPILKDDFNYYTPDMYAKLGTEW